LGSGLMNSSQQGQTDKQGMEFGLQKGFRILIAAVLSLGQWNCNLKVVLSVCRSATALLTPITALCANADGHRWAAALD
jgi:hypothetical protein